ncbi:MAG TPA: OmpA family protein [Alphaproteobacteria bacterium]|nr:OmpA family protein [Alphaproteobacteria bacterium]
MSARFSLTLCATAAACALMAPQPAMAQSDQPAASSGGGIEEVIVTARRREEKAQAVPITLLTFSQEQLQKQDIRDPLKLTDSIPGFNGATGGSLGLTYTFLRGAPGVIFYWNDVPVDPHNQTAGFYFDMENLQVLYGPQGTLFGLSNDAGAILFQPQKPKNDYEGYGQVTFGDYGRQTIEGVVNVPIIDDKLLIRVGGQYQKQDGYQHVLKQNIDLLNQNYWNFRGGMTFRPTDDISNELMVNYFQTQYLPGAYTYAGYNPDAADAFGFPLQTLLNLAQGPAGAVIPALEYAHQQLQGKNVDLAALQRQQEALGKYTLAGLAWVPTAVLRQLNIVNTTTWDVTDNISIKNIAGYQEIYNYTNRSDIGGLEFGLLQGPAPYGLHDQPRGPNVQYNEELQMIGNFFDNRLNLQVGTFNQWGGASSGAGGSVPSNSRAPYGIEYTNDFGGVSVHGATLNQQSRTNAVYAQGTYKLDDYVEGLSFTGGFRYTWDKFYSTGGNYCVVNVPGERPCTTPAHPYGTLTAFSSQSARFRSPSYTLQLNYQWRPSTMFYINNSLGYKTGGFNGQNFLDFPLFKPEHLNNYEAGIKTDFDLAAIGMEGVKNRINASYFYGVYRGIEIQTTGAYRTPAGPALGTPYIDVGDGNIWGWDLQWIIKPFADLTINLNAEYNKGSYKGFMAPNPAHVDNTTPAQILTEGVGFEILPQYKFNGGFSYHFGFIDPAIGDFTLSGDYSWVQTSLNTDRAGAIWADYIPGHHNIDMSLQWDNVLGHDGVMARAWVTNLTNNSVVNGCLCAYHAIGEIGFQPAQPRMGGITLRYSFSGGGEPVTPQAAYVPPPVAAPAPAPKSYLVFFDFNKSDLTPQAVDIVNTAAKNASAGKVTQLTVTGHTDTVGSDAYNMRLSRRRAESVAAQLEKDGIASSEISIVAKGKRDLLVPTADGVREPQNRRVQIVFDGGPTS